MENLEQRRRARNSQLRRRDQHSEVQFGEEYEKEMAVLPPMASSCGSMERKLPNVLCGSTPKGRIRRHKKGKCCRVLAKSGKGKAKSSKR